MLEEWFEDASVDQLQHDGWEPTPRGGLISFYINLSVWQEAATKLKACGKILSINSAALIDMFRARLMLGCVIPELKVKEKKNKDDFLRPLIFGKPSNIRTYLLVPDENFIESEHNPVVLDSFENLLAYSKHPQLAQAVSSIKNSKKRKGISAAVLAIAQRRPLSLIKDIPSVSKEDSASKIEITAVLVLHDNNKGFSFHSLQVKSSVTSEMLSNVSGINYLDKEINIVGCGSVGSALTDFLARSGHKRFCLWDDDIFEPHNNARHVLYQSYSESLIPFLGLKAENIKKRLIDINPEVNVRAKTNRFDEQVIPYLKPGTHVIDTTGESIEPVWLGNLTVPYTRIFIADQGRLSFLLTQIPNEIPDMLDIEAVLFSYASHNEQIKSWLCRESQLSNKMLGLSCSSSTMEMPWFKISNHTSASVFFKIVVIICLIFKLPFFHLLPVFCPDLIQPHQLAHSS